MLALKEVNQEKQHAKDKSERDDMTVRNHLILDFWKTQGETPLSIPNKDVNRHPPVGKEFRDTRIRKYPDGPQSEDGSSRLPTKVSFKGGSPPSCLNPEIPNLSFFLASSNLGTRFLLRVVGL